MATQELKAFTAGVFYLAGGLAAWLTTASSWSEPDQRTAAIAVLAAVAVVSGAGLLRWGRHLRVWGYHGVVASASCLLAAGVLLSSSHTTALGVAGLFVFCAIDILYFFTGWPAAAQILVLLLAVVMSLLGRGVGWGLLGTVLLVQVATIIVIARLMARAAHGTRDALTYLPNRRGFDERLDEAVTFARRTGTGLGLVLVDVDHFKSVNDRGGHAAGDALLHQLAISWRSVVPAGAVLTRHGGDEFALIAPGRDAQELLVLCQQLQQAAAPTGISMGAAQLADGEDGSSLVRRADLALYAAKAAGRGCIRWADDNDDALARDLATAITAGAITVALQPIVRPADGGVFAVEALARWRDDARGWVSPADFIAVAERSGLIGTLGVLVVQSACRDAQRLRVALGRDVLLTVNVSGQQLVTPDFVEELVMVLQDSGWPAVDLVVEVTESTVDIASTTARAALEELREVGVAVAIDDFGTGYSAFSQLDELPANYLKLDAAFTAQTTTSTRRTAMLRALLELCEQLSITVIAEGVETAEQAALLTSLGCPLVQGYYFARPAPVADLIAALSDRKAPAPAVL